MADPLSLAASIIAIGGAAATALKISRSLYRLARSIEGASEGIENFASDIRTFAVVVQDAQETLERHSKRQSSLEILQYITTHDVLNQLAHQSKRTTDRLKRVWKATDTIGSNLKLLTRLRWMLRKGEIQGLKPEMESLKTNLQLVMATVIMKHLLQMDDSEDRSEEIKQLKRQMQVHIETISFLQEIANKRQVWGEAHSDPAKSQLSSTLNSKAQKALISLSQSLIETDNVPGSDDRHMLDHNAGSSLLSISSPIGSTFSPTEMEDTDSMTEQPTSQSTVYQFDASSLRSSVRGSMNVGVDTQPENVKWKSEVALKYDTIPFNLISTELAAQVDVFVTPLVEANGDIWIDFGDEECQIVGTIKIWWKARNTTLTELECWVFRSESECLMLREETSVSLDEDQGFPSIYELM